MDIPKTLPVNRCEFARALLVAQRNALLRFLETIPVGAFPELQGRLLETANNMDDDASLPIWTQDAMMPDVREAATHVIEIALRDRRPKK